MVYEYLEQATSQLRVDQKGPGVPERSVTAQPGMVPGARRAAGTMFAALYGELVPHGLARSRVRARRLFPVLPPSARYGLARRQVGRGGSAERMLRAPGLWGMNDAGWNHPLAATEAGLISWFQVEASAVAGDRPLPVQPFLQCAQDATARAGRPNLSAVQVLLPVQGLDPASRPPYAPVPSMLTKEWFAECVPEGRTPVEVNINSGRDPSIAAVAPQLTDHLDHLDRDVFVCGSHDVASQDAVLPPPGEVTRLRTSPSVSSF